MIRAIVGANWGDEGKGKITDLLAEKADMVVRFQGGANAGHTIINEAGKFVLHMLPSGVLYTNTLNVIGNGMAFDVERFRAEVEELASRGVHPQLAVSDRAQVVMPYHPLFDAYEEARLKGRQFGSTKSGIAPFYSDKFAKIGFQVSELFEEESLLREKIEGVLALKNCLLEHFYHQPLLKTEDILKILLEWRDYLAPFVQDTSALLRQAEAEGKVILLEGQLGTLKDPDHGIYPFTTSSSTLAGYAAVGAGICPSAIQEIVAVTKAYSSSVGAGAFVSEIFDAEADELRNRGGDKGEFGATTGRPRRVGWFDVVATRYGAALQGANQLALTNIDVLGYLPQIPVCVAYEIDGKRVENFPVTRELNKAKPIIEMMPGWNRDIRGVKSWEELPKEAQDYVAFVEKSVGLPIKFLSTGPERDETILR